MRSWKHELFPYLSATWRYRWRALAAAWAICLLGWIGVALVPNRYQSVAEVYIDTHTLLRPLLQGLAVTPDPNQQIAVMLQALLTDPTLERVVRATNPSASSLPPSQMREATDRLRRNVSLTNLSAKDLYSISFRDEDPGYAQSVAQTLVSVLIDSSLGGQRRDADQVGTFIDSQIASYERKLEAADKRRADFKTGHLDFFASTPDGDKVGGAGDVVAARAAVVQAENLLSEATNRRDTLRQQLKTTPETLNVNSASPAIMDSTSTAISHNAQLAAAISKLNVLRTQFTDNYPDVVVQRRLIARLKKVGTHDTSGTEGISNPSYVMVKSKLTDAETEIAVDHSRLEDAKSRLEQAKSMAAQAITVQREYENLDRDYRVLHDNYEKLVTRRESANITQAAGDQQSAFVFRVISPPIKPDRPVTPNRFLLNAAVLLLGLAGGGCLAFGLGQFSGKFQSLGQLKEAFELPVLGVVTAVRSRADVMASLRSSVFFVTGLSVLIASYLMIVFFLNREFLQSMTAGGIGSLL